MDTLTCVNPREPDDPALKRSAADPADQRQIRTSTRLKVPRGSRFELGR
jgi:hypothetical protein